MKRSEKNNLYIRVANFGNDHPEGFTSNELIEGMELNEWEEKIINEFIRNALMNGNYNGHELGMQSNLATMFLTISRDSGNAKFILNHDAYFNFIDFLELQESRKSSKGAMWTAIVAIIISIIMLCIQIYSTFKVNNEQLINNQNLSPLFNNQNFILKKIMNILVYAIKNIDLIFYKILFSLGIVLLVSILIYWILNIITLFRFKREWFNHNKRYSVKRCAEEGESKKGRDFFLFG